VAVLASIGYFFVPEAAQVTLYNAIGISAGAVMIFGALRNGAEPTAAWLLLGGGILAFAAGDVVFGEGQSVPSPADMLYISAYPLLALGLGGLSPWRRSRGSIATAVAISIAVAVVCGVFLIVPSDGDTSQLTTRLVAVGYPVMDVGLLALLLRAWRYGSPRTPTVLIATACVLMFVADVVYAMSDFGAGYDVGNLIDAAWLFSYAFFGAGVLAVRAESYGFAEPEPVEAYVRPSGGVATLERTTQTRSTFVRQASDLQFRLIVCWTGRLLFALGGLAVVLGATWMAADVILLGGAYVITGFGTWVVSGHGLRLA
jgi:hypothetical protein